MKYKLKYFCISAVLVILSIACAVLLPRDSLAVSEDSMLGKVYSGLLYRCYKGGYIKPSVNYTGSSLDSPYSLWDMKADSPLFTNAGMNDSSVLFPNGWVSFRTTGGSESNTIMNDSTTCRSLIEGISTGALSGISGKYTLPTDAVSELKALGYTQDTSTGDSTSCISFGYDNVLRAWNSGLGTALGSNGSFRVGEICYSTSGSKKMIKSSAPMSITLTEEAKANGFNVSYRDDGQLIISFTSKAQPIHNWSIEIPYMVNGKDTIWELGTIDQIAATINEGLSDSARNPSVFTEGRCKDETCYYVLEYQNNATFTTKEGSEAGKYSWVGSSPDTASLQASRNILKESSRSLTDSEVATIYMNYVSRYMSHICDPNESAMVGVNTDWKVRLKEDGVWKDNCYITSSTLDSYNGVDGNNVFGVKVTIDDILAFLRSDKDISDANGLSSDPNGDDPTISVDDKSKEEAKEDAPDVCYGSPGTLGMSWILCPILAGTSNGLNYIYGEIEENYLAVSPSFFSTDNSTYKAWSTFQNVANIILVIFLLVVIFSQLTGIGIDNYGIKKILPRLIICAILINLSYFIAQFLVDTSNIIGNSIRGLFEGVDPGVVGKASAEGVSIPSHILGIAVLAGTAGWISGAIANPAMLLTLLLAIISGLFAVLMMWLILVVRQAGVMVAVVIAPVAFALYLLPNTSKFTKSWWNLMKSLLLLYPLAGLLIGASFFVSNLMLGGDDNVPNGDMILPAMILRVAPFFALPALFKKSVDAMGNLGTKIQGIGRGFSRGATGAMRNADWYKNTQERGLERRTRIRAGIDRDGKEATGWRGLLRSRSDRNRARYRQQYLKTQAEQDKANLLNTPEYLEAMRNKQELERQSERNEVDLMNSPDYRSALQAKQDVELEKKQTEAQASALTTGKFQRTDGKAVDSSSINSLRLALQFEASRNGEQDIGKIRALYDALLAKGDDGIDALAKAWDSGELKGEGFKRIMESIASDGNIKAKARSLHATANDVMSPSSGVTYTAGQVEAARTAGTYASKIKPEMLSGMTDDERNSYIQYANTTLTASSTPAERESVSNAMRNVYLASQNINSFKPGEQAAVNDVADKYIWNHMELAKAGTYVDKYGTEVKLRRDADNKLVFDANGKEVSASYFGNDPVHGHALRLKRN